MSFHGIGIYENPSQLHSEWGKVGGIPTKIQNRQGRALPHVLSNTGLEVLARAFRQEKLKGRGQAVLACTSHEPLNEGTKRFY